MAYLSIELPPTESRRKAIIRRVESRGLMVATWSPGDGLTRYTVHAQHPSNANRAPAAEVYGFAIFYAHGLAQLETWIHGYESGREVPA